MPASLPRGVQSLRNAAQPTVAESDEQDAPGDRNKPAQESKAGRLFRERLVPYMNLILEHKNRQYSPAIDAVTSQLSAEQLWLSQTYGRLFKAINPSGDPPPMTMGYGSITTSYDVIADAIHKPFDVYYNDLSRLADQYLTMRIGRMQGEAMERAEGRRLLPEVLIRITSLGFWVGRLWALIRWLVITKGGRIAGLIGALLLAVVTAFVTGWAGSLFAR